MCVCVQLHYCLYVRYSVHEKKTLFVDGWMDAVWENGRRETWKWWNAFFSFWFISWIVNDVIVVHTSARISFFAEKKIVIAHLYIYKCYSYQVVLLEQEEEYSKKIIRVTHLGRAFRPPIRRGRGRWGIGRGKRGATNSQRGSGIWAICGRREAPSNPLH